MPSTLLDYEVLDTIGSGSYGVCRKVQRKRDGKILVWKELQYGTMSEEEKQLLVSEVNLLRELRHQHIVRYYDRIIDRANAMLYIVMEYCEGGDLASLITQTRKDSKKLEEPFVWKIAAQIVSALKECHSRQKNGRTVLHRDLKPANIFLDGRGNVKLGDFGLARVLSHDTSFASTFVGTPYYMSPEQVNHMAYNAKSDVWSLGCLLYELCSLSPPFLAANQRELAVKIRYGKFPRLPANYSDELNSFVRNLLQVDDVKRPDVEMLCQHAVIATLLPVDCRKPSLDSVPDEVAATAADKHIAEVEELLSAREESVRSREDAVLVRERDVSRRERQLNFREKELALKEQLFERKVKRAEKVLNVGHNNETKPSDIPTRLASCLQDVLGQLPTHGCLVQSSPERGDQAKKRVTFTADKENVHKVKDDKVRTRTATVVRLLDRPLPPRRSSVSADLAEPMQRHFSELSRKRDEDIRQNNTAAAFVLK